MKSPPWLRYVHWFGYLSSFIVILQLIALSYIGGNEWIRQQSRRDETRMHSGSIINRLTGEFYGEAKAILNVLPPPSTLVPEGLRFVAMPSFGDTYFALSLRRTPTGGDGEMFMISLQGQDDEPKPVQIHLSVESFTKLLADLDTISASWQGEASWWTDGTGVVFERVRGTEITSGMGNSPNFYGKVGEIIFNALQPSTPQLARFQKDWRPKEATEGNGR